MNNFPWGEKEQAEFQKEAEEFSEKYDNGTPYFTSTIMHV